MSYFQNEIWPTGPGTDIRVAGNLVSTANPFIISQGDPPTAAISIGNNDISITRNVDIVGTFTINGSPIDVTVDVADLAPGVFGANEAPGAFSFGAGLNVTGILAVDSATASFYIQRLDVGLDFSIDEPSGEILISAYDGINRTGLTIDGAIVNFDVDQFQLNGERVPSLQFFQPPPVVTMATVDWFEGSVQEYTIDSDVTFSFVNPIAGRTYVLIIVQGTGGTRTPTLTGWDFGDNPPVWSTAVGAKDVVTGVYDGTQYLAAQAVANA